MSEDYYRNQLYPLQDKVLDSMRHLNTGFYLTGGTLLSRYILHHRLSDDLDFFINASANYNEKVAIMMEPVLKAFPSTELSSKQDAYTRYFISDGGVKLKIEWINDVQYRTGSPNLENGLWLDSWENILSNKLTALGRNEGKDFVDILFLSLKFPFNWEYIIDEAKKKDANINEIEVSERLMNFDLGLLSGVRFPASFNLSTIDAINFKTMARESLHGFDNSLYN